MSKGYFLLAVVVFVTPLCGKAQRYNASSVFAHNDYERAVPFYTAYHERVGFIEADVFLVDGRLLVAHTRRDIDTRRTLDDLYLRPLADRIAVNNGYAYPDSSELTLMIDIKSDGHKTLQAIIKTLKEFSALIKCPTLHIAVSGNVPPFGEWDRYPAFIQFDGRPGIDYPAEALKRIRLISAGFRDYSAWNGKGLITSHDRARIDAVVKGAHMLGKPFRFWGFPDFVNAWIVLKKLDVDVINTDRVIEVGTFLREMPRRSYLHGVPNGVYTPRYDEARWAKSPRNLILLIGDGMGLAQLYAGFTANRGALSIFSIRDIGFSITTPADGYITDSAAGASAMATGTKTNNRAIAISPSGTKLEPISRSMQRCGFRVALISSGDITDATPAAFYANRNDRGEQEGIALDYTAHPLDILIGGGKDHFAMRTDQRDLLAAMKSRGITITTAPDISAVEQSKGIVVLNDSASMPVTGRGDFLNRALHSTLDRFEKQHSPFFIMMEGAQIDWAGHGNDMEYLVREVLDFDRAVGEALAFADKDGETLVVVTADHETGGLSLIDGDMEKGYVHGAFSTNDHTAIPVPVFAYGPGAHFFRGVYENTELYTKLFRLFLPQNQGLPGNESGHSR